MKFFWQNNYTEKAKILYFLNLVYFLSLVGLWQNHVIYLPLTGLTSRYTTPFTTRNVCITKYARLYELSNGIMVITPKQIGFFPFHRGIMWPSLVNIQYTELKLSCRNDPVIKNYIHSNSDLDIWPNDPKINIVLPLRQGNHVVKIGKDPMYRTNVMRNDPVVKNSIYSNSDLDLWPNDLKK